MKPLTLFVLFGIILIGMAIHGASGGYVSRSAERCGASCK